MTEQDASRWPVAYVTRRNGAWLIHFVGDHPRDCTEDENVDAAASLATAKRIAKQGARAYATNLRWVKDDGVGGWVLHGVENEWGD